MRKQRTRAVSLAEGMALSVMVEGQATVDATVDGQEEVVRHAVLWPYSDSFSTQYLRSQSSSNLGSKADSKAGSKTSPDSPHSGLSRQSMPVAQWPALLAQGRLRVFFLFLYSLCLLALSLWIIFFGTVDVVENQTHEVLRLCGFYLAIVVIWISSGVLAYIAVVALYENGCCGCSTQDAGSCGPACCGLCGLCGARRGVQGVQGVNGEILEKSPAVASFTGSVAFEKTGARTERTDRTDRTDRTERNESLC